MNQDLLQHHSPHNLPSLPNTTASLVLGILSLIFCFIYGIPGLVLGIIGLVLGNKDRALYKANPLMYSPASYNNSNAGRICSLIGVILSALFLLTLAIVIAFLGSITNGFKDLSNLGH
jgi:M penetrans paralogue family 26